MLNAHTHASTHTHTHTYIDGCSVYTKKVSTHSKTLNKHCTEKYSLITDVNEMNGVI